MYRKVIIALVMALMVSAVNVAFASSTTVVVTSADVSVQAEDTPPQKSWVAYFRNAGSDVFMNGPAQPPLGAGSLQLTTPTGADKITVFNFDHVGTKLADINAISYSTYRTAGELSQVAALNIQVDVNGTGTAGGFTTLVFEPVYNTNQGPVTSGTWQFWDAYNAGNAIWWSSNPIPGAPNRDTFVSWSTIVAANPGAVILGGFGVNQGSGNPALVTAVDALTFGTPIDSVTYDFELTPPPPPTPSCNGQTATIYVKDGKIVGGSDNGKTYKGKLTGTTGNDVIVGTEGNDTVDAKAGNDTICGLGGNDNLTGDAGIDYIDGGSGKDILKGSGGNDTLLGGVDDDKLDGDDGNDTLNGGAGNDLLDGDKNNDTLTGGTGADKFKGGDGTDTATDFNAGEGDTKSSIP